MWRTRRQSEKRPRNEASERGVAPRRTEDRPQTHFSVRRGRTGRSNEGDAPRSLAAVWAFIRLPPGTVVVILLLSVSARAEEKRFGAALRGTFFSGYPDLLSVTATAWWRPIVIEAEAWTLPATDSRDRNGATGYAARAGMLFSISDMRDQRGFGATVDAPLMVGFEQHKSLRSPGCGDASVNCLGVTATASLGWSFYFAQHFGVGAQVSFGWLYELLPGTAATDPKTVARDDVLKPRTDFLGALSPIGRLSAGVVF